MADVFIRRWRKWRSLVGTPGVSAVGSMVRRRLVAEDLKDDQ